MDNSTYSGIDQEPNGKPVGPRGLAPTFPISQRAAGSALRKASLPPPIPLEAAVAATFRRGRLPEAYPRKVAGITPEDGATSSQGWAKTQTEELDISRMDEEGAAQTRHAGNESGEHVRPSTGSFLRSFWSRIWR